MKKRLIRGFLAFVLLWSAVNCVPLKAEATTVDGWRWEDGRWYYYKDEAKATGWVQDGNAWYYMDETGAMVTGEFNVEGTWNLFNGSGVWLGAIPENGWFYSEGGKWHYYQNYEKAVGWLQDGNAWYYMDETGTMVTGAVDIEGTWHRFNSSGIWQRRTSSAKMIEILKTIEGFSAYPYWDNSQYSVGYGTECPADKYNEYMANGIPEEEALELLAQALDRFETSVGGFLHTYGLALEQHQFDALVMFSYNCGAGWTNETTGYFNNAVRNGAKGTDFLYAICLWSSSGGRFILTDRRMSEANMYLNGVYEAYSEAEDGTYPENFKHVYMDGNGGSVNYIMHGYDALDAAPIITQVTAPAGYEFAGWYTASTGGTKVEVLDGTLENGAVLFAQWQDANGKIVALPKGTPCFVRVKTKESVNVRTGPGTYYPKAGEMLAADTTLVLTQTYTYSGSLWGKSQYGWVSLDYTNYAQVQAGLETWPRNGTVNTDGVNVRKGPGTSYDRVGGLNAGAAVTILESTSGEGLRWGRISDVEWICLDYVTLEPVNQSGWAQVDDVWYYVTSDGGVAIGWAQIGGAWYYFDANGIMQSGWQEINGQRYFFNSSGAMVTGWQYLDGVWFYFNAEGIMLTGWQEIYSNRYYFESNGAMVTGTVTIDGVQHMFDTSGAWLGEVQEQPQKNGWVNENGTWYYYNNDVKATGWLWNGAWYYLDENGAMVTGWLQLGNTWYYLYSYGAMATGWQNIGGTWYYFNGGGAMVTGWLWDGVWYYMAPYGAMTTGWHSIDGTWYYFNGSGVMQTGWVFVDNVWFFLNSSGAWVG